MRYGNVDTYLEKFGSLPVDLLKRDGLRRQVEYRSTVDFLVGPIHLDPAKEASYISRVDAIVQLHHSSFTYEQLKSNEEWVSIHLEHDDIKNCYINYTKEYRVLEQLAIKYLQINEGSNELEQFTNSKHLNSIIDRLCNIRYRKKRLEKYLNEPPDLE